MTAIRWVVEQRVGGEWLACRYGPHDTEAEAVAELAVILTSGMTTGPFRIEEVPE